MADDATPTHTAFAKKYYTKKLFVWLEIGKLTKPGTAVCRITTNKGGASFELPISAKTPSLGKFQGLAQNDVLYQIQTEQFAVGNSNKVAHRDSSDSLILSSQMPGGGDLEGVREHLDYLKELGVTTLLLTPVVKNSRGGPVDWYAINPRLGSIKDYQELVAEAHRRHMKIFFDTELDRVGPEHPWVKNPPTEDLFRGKAQRYLETSPLFGSFYGNPQALNSRDDQLEALMDPHAPTGLSRNFPVALYAGIRPDLNTENPLVAQYLLQNSIWWTQSSGLDGFFIRAIPSVSRQFWASWHGGLRRIYPYLTTIGEIYHRDPSVTSFFMGGQRRFDGIDSGVSTVLDFPLNAAINDVLQEKASVGRLAEVLRHDALYPHSNALVAFIGNENVPRFAGGGTPAKLKLALGLLLTMRGIPQLYFGDEIGLDNDKKGDRRSFPAGSGHDAGNAFVAAGRTAPQQEIFEYVQSLLRLHREHPALSGGQMWDLASDNFSFVFVRVTDEERILVAFNNAGEARELSVPVADTPVQNVADFSLLSGSAGAYRSRNSVLINMPAQSLSIFALN